MILIIGGHAQGKLDFAKKLGETEECVNGESCNITDIFDLKIIDNLHILIKKMIEQGIEPVAFIEESIERLKDKIIISNEIGLGVVPIDKNERIWREATGRVCCYLAKEANEVFRVYAGIPQKIKG